MKRKVVKTMAAVLLLSLIVSAVVALLPLSAQAASVDLSATMQSKVFSDEAFGDKTMPYRIYVPQTYDAEKHYKLLLMMHGAGERGSDNLKHVSFSTGTVWARKIIADAKLKEEFIILAPQCPTNDVWVDWTNFYEGCFEDKPQTTASKMAAAILFQTIVDYSIDMSRIYVTGLSMGGCATYDFVARYPGLFAAAVPMCGGCDVSTAEAVALTPLWTFHCDNDVTVLPTSNKAMVQKLRQMGAGVLFTEYHGIGHNSWVEGYRNENAFNWMINQQRVRLYWSDNTVETPVQQDSHVAKYGNAIVSNAEPTGCGSKTLSVISDGFADVHATNAQIRNNVNDYSWQQYDTYGVLSQHYDYFGYEFSQPYEFEQVEYQAGIYFGDGGWFAQGVTVQVRADGVWTDVTLLEESTYPVVGVGENIDFNAYPGFERYVFRFQSVVGDAIRIYGLGGGTNSFASCAELDVIGSVANVSEETPQPTEKQLLQVLPQSIDDNYVRERIEGAWVGQMAGVVWGATTEFANKGSVIAESAVPNISSLNYNDAFTQDDLYVEIPFIEALIKEGLDVSVETMGRYFGATYFPLWHGNDVARNNILSGINAPLSGNFVYNSCCDDIDWQIESDFVGMISPGLVNVASDLAFNYGHVIGYGDGVYGGVYVSAMHAKAFTAQNVLSIIVSGQQSVPEGSLFRSLIDDVMYWYANDVSFLDCWQKLQDKWADTDRCPREGFGGSAPFNIDAKLNAGYCLMGLLYGEGDLEKSMKLSMICGQDSDCNPSTVGSILGNFYGVSNIPEKFKLGIDYTNSKFSYTTYTLNDAIENVFALAKQNFAKNGGEISDGVWEMPLLQQVNAVQLEVWEPMPSIEHQISRNNKTLSVKVAPYYAKGVSGVEWDFGDGSEKATTLEATHVYQRMGDYTVTLKVFGKDGSVATRYFFVNVTVDNNLAGGEEIVIRNEEHAGSGASDVGVITDGVIGNTSSTQYDTYYSDAAPAHDDFFGIKFATPQTINMVKFTTGSFFNNGGWFENISVQILQNNQWTNVTLTNDPQFPDGTSMDTAGKMYATYVFTFDDVLCDGVRVYGAAGGSAHFVSCSEFEVYGPIEPSFEQENYTYNFETSEFCLNFDGKLLAVDFVKVNDVVVDSSQYTLTNNGIVFKNSAVNSLFRKNNVLTIVFENAETISANVEVVQNVVDLELDLSALRAQYALGESLDVSNIVVYKVLSDGTKQRLQDEFELFGYDANTLGEQTVSVSYLSFCKQFIVKVVCQNHNFGNWQTVKEASGFSDGEEKRACANCGTEETRVTKDEVTGIELVAPNVTVYCVCEELSLDGLGVKLVFASGAKEQLDLQQCTVDQSQADMTKAGKFTITVSYLQYSKQFSVKVFETSASNNTVIIVSAVTCVVVSAGAVAFAFLYVRKFKRKNH